MIKKFAIPLTLIVVIAASLIYLNTMNTSPHYQTISPAEFKQKTESSDYSILDVRTAEEFKQGHIKNAKNIDYYQIEKLSAELDKLDKNKKYLVYCRSGNRSSKTIQIMKEKGFTNIDELQGGIVSWTASQLPIEPCTSC